MGTPAAQPQTQSAEQRATAGIVIVLLSNLSLPDTEAHIIPLLEGIGIGEQAAKDAVALILPQIDPASRTPLLPAPPRIERVPAPNVGEGLPAPPEVRVTPGEARTPAQTFTRTTEVPRHSRYLMASARRFDAATSSQAEGQAIMAKERRYLAQHLNAVRFAREAAQRVDNAVQRYGTTELGWVAHMDSRTTPECRAANGATFSALRPPLIGYPGTLHGGTCRCHAGAAKPGALTVDQATAALRQNAVIPFATELSDA